MITELTRDNLRMLAFFTSTRQLRSMKSKFIVKNQYREELIDEEPIFVTEGNLRVDSNGNKISELCNKCSREGLKVPGSCESRGCLGSSRRRPSTFGGGGNEETVGRNVTSLWILVSDTLKYY